MKLRSIRAVTVGSAALATAAAIPVFNLDRPAERDLASWIEVDDPPASLLEPVPTREGLVVPELETRTPPVPHYRSCVDRASFAVALAFVPEAPAHVDEPESPVLAEATVSVVFEVPAPGAAPISRPTDRQPGDRTAC